MSEEKNEVNLKILYAKALKNEKSFLYYENSKSKINTIIRKNKLPDYVVEYLWQSKIYKKEVVKYQSLTPKIREDIIKTSCTSYLKSPWTSVLINFLKEHNPTEDEVSYLLSNKSLTDSGLSPTDVYKQKMSIILDCWSMCPDICHKIDADEMLYKILNSTNAPMTEHNLRRIISAVSHIISKIPDMRMTLLGNIVKDSEWVINKILGPALKGIFIEDEIVSYLLKNLKSSTFKNLVKMAMHRENVSENMIAKIYLTID